MKKHLLPAPPEGRARAGIRSEISPMALQRWDKTLQAADASDENVISIFDFIGYDDWTGQGVNASSIANQLRYFGGQPVTVNVNSPGGDVFEGLAIYNLFRQYPGQVNMKVIGVAASIASVIVMGGDDVQIARAAFFMIHNAWVVAAGNRHDLRAIADTLEVFDGTLADIYVARTGTDVDDIKTQLDNETWIGGSEAVSQGFADSLLASDEVKKGEAQAKGDSKYAARRLDAVLAKAGMSRTERRNLINEIKTGTPSAASPDGTLRAAVPGKPSAADTTAHQGKQLAGFNAALLGMALSALNVSNGDQ
jgi:ATP-dependent Clp protease protease subunit